MTDNWQDHETIFADRNHFITLLARGWRFSDDIAEPMLQPHGEYSVYLTRAV